MGGCDGAASPGTIFHNHRLPQAFLQTSRNQARNQIS
jgi:hypothetical protein